MMELRKIKSDVMLDARGKYCPEPLTLTAKKMREEVQPGQVLEVWAEDEAAVEDLSRWCKRTGNEMIGYLDDSLIQVKLSGANAVRRFFIKKASL